MGFDEWFDENYHDLNVFRFEAKFIFNSSFDIQQAKINGLQSENKKLDAWYRNVKLQLENKTSDCDELQKRIDEALTQVSNHYHSCVARKNLKRMSASVSEIAEIEAHESNMIVLENILRGEK